MLRRCWSFFLAILIGGTFYPGAHSFFDGFYDAVKTVGDVFGDIATISSGILKVGNIINEAVEEHCIYRCPNGKKPESNRNHVPRSDGCGSFGIHIPKEQMPISELTLCCNEHDICYDTCNKDKEKCDYSFKKCLYQICETYKNSIRPELHTACKIAAKGMFTGTTALGCKAYKDAQGKACVCRDKKRQDL